MKAIAEVLNWHLNSGIDVEETLFDVALVVLWRDGLLGDLDFDGICRNIESMSWSSSVVQSIMVQWQNELKNLNTKGKPAGLLHEIVNRLSKDDPIGMIYQSMVAEGGRSLIGSYYTPREIVRDAVSNLDKHQGRFLDPSCGTGIYLIEAIRQLHLTSEQVFGFDIDPIAIRIAKLNVLREFQYEDVPLNLQVLDSIGGIQVQDSLFRTNEMTDSFDFVATNPPWGSYTRIGVSLAPSSIRSSEASSLMIEKCLNFMRTGGEASFLLPESILKTSVHRDVRQLLLRHTKITRIVELGNAFPGVMSRVVRVDFIKEEQSVTTRKTEVIGQGHSHNVDTSRFLHNVDFVFDVGITDLDAEVLHALFDRNVQFLDERSDWAIGVVTGDNRRSVREEQSEGMIGVIKGSDVSPYFISPPQNFLYFEASKFQQVPKVEIFNAPEKLIYRFISNRLVFALDVKQQVTLNSANILIPRLEGISVRVALGFLNSTLFNYISMKKFDTNKVLKGNLKQLPFPELNPLCHNEIERLVQNQLDRNSECQEEIDEAVFKSFQVGESMVSHMQRETRKLWKN